MSLHLFNLRRSQDWPLVTILNSRGFPGGPSLEALTEPTSRSIRPTRVPSLVTSCRWHKHATPRQQAAYNSKYGFSRKKRLNFKARAPVSEALPTGLCIFHSLGQEAVIPEERSSFASGSEPPAPAHTWSHAGLCRFATPLFQGSRDAFLPVHRVSLQRKDGGWLM